MQRFSSKVDWWLAVIVISAPLSSVGIVVAGLMTGDTGTAVRVIISFAFVLALYHGIVWPIAYGVHDREPHSTNPLASLALSLDRIRVDRGGDGVVLVSPADRVGFAQTILSRAPGVEVDERLRFR